MNTVIFYNDDGDVVRWVITPDESSAETPPGLNRLVLNYELDNPTAWIVQGGVLVENPSPGIVISADQVLIEGNQIRLTGDTVVDGSFTVTGPMIAPGALVTSDVGNIFISDPLNPFVDVNPNVSSDAFVEGVPNDAPGLELTATMNLKFQFVGASPANVWRRVRLQLFSNRQGANPPVPVGVEFDLLIYEGSGNPKQSVSLTWRGDSAKTNGGNGFRLRVWNDDASAAVLRLLSLESVVHIEFARQ